MRQGTCLFFLCYVWSIFDIIWNSLLSPSQVEELSRVIQSASEPAGFSPDIEEEANKKFQMIYSGAMSIEDAIVTLRNFKSSQVAREQKVILSLGLLFFDMRSMMLILDLPMHDSQLVRRVSLLP